MTPVLMFVVRQNEPALGRHVVLGRAFEWCRSVCADLFRGFNYSFVIAIK